MTEENPIAAALTAAVPLVRTLGLQYVEVSAERAVLRATDRPELRNHVGGPHAGVLFSLGESASGAVVIGNFAEQMGRATPLPSEATIRYRRIALGDVTAEAVLGRSRDEVLAELDAGETPRFPVEVTIRDCEGEVTSEMTVTWVLRPNR